MDSLGIEIKEGSWSLVHLRSTIFGVKPEGFVRLAGTSDEDKLAELKDYIKGRGMKNPRIAVGLSRGSAVSRVLEIPAPDRSALGGILKFELEKHIPFRLEEACYGYQVLKREKNIFSLFMVAAAKQSVDGTTAMLSSAGFKPVVVGVWQESVFNALFHHKKLSPGKNVAAVSIDGGSLSIDIFSGLSPVFSKCSQVGAPKTEHLAGAVKRELGRALSSAMVTDGRLDEVIVIMDSASNDGFPEALADSTGIRVSALKFDDPSMPASAAHALGLALMADGRGKLNISLASDTSPEDTGRSAYTVILTSFVALLLAVVGASYLLRDAVAIKRLESAISEASVEKEKVEALLASLKDSEERSKALDTIKGSYPATSLDLLKELTELLPNDTWLTVFEYSNGTAVIEGFSEMSSSLVLKMEKSALLKDIEFTGPVTKSGNGKEHFRIKFSVADGTLKTAGAYKDER